MDRVICLFVQERYDELEELLDTDLSLEPSDYFSLLNYFICLLKHGLINDRKAFLIVFLLLDKNFSTETSSVDQYLSEIKQYSLTHRLLKNSINLLMTEQNLKIIMKELQSTGGTLTKFFTDQSNLEEMDKIISDDARIIINSFFDVSFINSIRNNNKPTKQWEAIISEEIKIRLICLVDLFGHKFLNFMDIPLIKIEDYEAYNYKQKVEYYLTCISRTNYGLRTIEKILRNRDKLCNKLEHMSHIYLQLKKGYCIDEVDDQIQGIVGTYFD